MGKMRGQGRGVACSECCFGGMACGGGRIEASNGMRGELRSWGCELAWTEEAYRVRVARL